jgi:hypothetical protein
MAESYAHRWGQIIGLSIETAIHPILVNFAAQYDLYLDSQGPRPARPSHDVIWIDQRGNRHKLDFVLERGGASDRIGLPVAFIEVAWRRYTKHSKNKAQEIEAAIQPLLHQHRFVAPFFGVILSGVFTQNAIAQLITAGAKIAYLPYATIIEAFQTIGIDAAFDELTPESAFEQKIGLWHAASLDLRLAVATTIRVINQVVIDAFMSELARIVQRKVATIRIFPFMVFKQLLLLLKRP